MISTGMFWPMFGMATLTAVAWAVMGRRRQAAIKARAMSLESFSGTADVAMTPAVSVSTRHFANHFEIPVLFHVVCLAHLATQVGGWLPEIVAWLFVVLRGLHMREHLGPNRIMRRFQVFAASTLLVWLLWLHLGAVLLLRS